MYSTSVLPVCHSSFYRAYNLISTITEIKSRLVGPTDQFDCELLHTEPGHVIAIYRMPEEMLLEDVLLPRGTVSYGYFWQDQPYNAYHWIDNDGQTLALYLNICDNTRLLPDRIEWRDLMVDILITPDRRCRVLDEDELPDDLDTDLRAHIEITRDWLCAQPQQLLSDIEQQTARLFQQ